MENKAKKSVTIPSRDGKLTKSWKPQKKTIELMKIYLTKQGRDCSKYK